MINTIKKQGSSKLVSLSLLALSLATYTTNGIAVEPIQPVVAPPSYTTDIIAQMIKGMIASSAWQKEATAEIYRLSEHRLIWLNNKQIDVALKLLAQAPISRGLKSEDYYSSWLNLTWQQLKANPEPSFQQLALFDTTLSNSLLGYLSDLHYGRVNPQKVSFDFQVNKEHLKLAQMTLAAAKEGTINTLADKLEPTLIFYRNQKQALNRYQQAAQEHKAIIFKFSHPLTEGNSDPQIPELRRLLTTLGDVVSAAKNSTIANSPIYDATLADGVKNFQQRHGLAANGALNKETVSALNIPLVNRIAQIELGLERLRWIPPQQEDRMVLVNIPSFRLWAFDSLTDQNSKPLTMRVVVGEAEDKQTPSLSSKMDYVEFRPTWTVPQSIIKKEMLPKLRDNPGYFAQRGMKVTYKDDGRISIRQESGDKNALGLVKFLFPNNHAVYFHDTPMQKYFSRSRRDFSHGCVRLANPELLAEYALKQQKTAWTQERIKKAMHTGGSKRITLERPIPIVIFYGTALAIDNHGISFFNDIYGHDAKLKRALAGNKKKG
jgi:murein L,D-transpeptidase YcbB/YkuD